MSAIVFVDEPPSFGRPAPVSRWQPILDELKANPKKWAIVVRGKTSDVTAAYIWLRKRGCEAATRQDGLERVCYARFVGSRP